MNDLEIQQLVKRFGSHTVVDHISFHVNSGEFFVLLGPSGGGKTTLLRMISGLESPDEGRILLNQQDITHAPPRQRNLGMVFQDYGLYPNMDVHGNIAYGLEARHVARHEIEKRVAQAAEALGLTPYLRKLAVDLSGGEQQRVAIARAMVKDADAYLYDEPLANLDPKLRYQARRDILALHRLKQRPSVYVTHDQSEAISLADRIAVIAHGRLQQVGTPDEILHRPANTFMARFVGSPPMNLLNGQLASSEDAYSTRVDGMEIPLSGAWSRALQQVAGDEVIVGIHPDAFIPEWQFASLDQPPQALYHACVEEVEPLIGEVVVTLQFGQHTRVRAVFEDADVPLPEAGTTLQVGLELERLCLFNPVTEQLLAREVA